MAVLGADRPNESRWAYVRRPAAALGDRRRSRRADHPPFVGAPLLRPDAGISRAPHTFLYLRRPGLAISSEAHDGWRREDASTLIVNRDTADSIRPAREDEIGRLGRQWGAA